MGGGSVEEFEKLIIEAATLVLERAALAVKNKEKLTEKQLIMVKRSLGQLILSTAGTKDDLLLELAAYYHTTPTTKLQDIPKVPPTKLPDLQKIAPDTRVGSESLPVITAAAAGRRHMRGGDFGGTLFVAAMLTYIVRGGYMVHNYLYEPRLSKELNELQWSCGLAVSETRSKCPYPVLISGDGHPTWEDDWQLDWVCSEEGSATRCKSIKEKLENFKNVDSTCQETRANRITRISRNFRDKQLSTWSKDARYTPEVTNAIMTDVNKCYDSIRTAYGDAPPGWTYEAEPEGFDRDQEEEAYAKANKVSPTRKKQQQASMSPRAVSPIDFTRTERRNSFGTTQLSPMEPVDGGGRRVQSRKTKQRRLRKARRTRRNKRAVRK